MELAERLVNKYPWLSSEQAEDLVKIATGWFYTLSYPCEPFASEDTRPIDNAMDSWYVSIICDEIAQRNGFNTETGYKENGFTAQYDGAWISDRIVNAIKPIIGVIGD